MEARIFKRGQNKRKSILSDRGYDKLKMLAKVAGSTDHLLIQQDSSASAGVKSIFKGSLAQVKLPVLLGLGYIMGSNQRE